MPRFPRTKRANRAVAARIESVERRLLLSTYTVNSLSDAVNAGAGSLTLRQAVADVNAHGGANTIAFDPKVFSPGSLHTITLLRGQLELTNTTGQTTIAGPGSAVLAISGNHLSRVFQFDAGVTAVVSGVTITKGNASIADGNGDTFGGAIYSAGTLTLDRSAVISNTVSATGLLGTGAGATAGIGLGGGIFASGNLTITHSTLSSNTVSNTAVTSNAANSAPAGLSGGGAVFCAGSLVMSNDVVSGNSVTGLNATDSASDGGEAEGGGIYASGAVSISASSISNNTALGGATALGNSPAAGGNASGGGLFTAGAATLSGTTVTANTATGGGGAFAAGTAGGGSGGGIYAKAALTTSNSNVSGNAATSIGNFNTNLSAGGGIYSTGGLTLTLSQVDQNNVVGGPQAITASSPSASGGGIFSSGAVSINQSSVSYNIVGCLQSEFGQPGGECVGGGLIVSGGGTILDSTFAGDLVTGGAGANAQAGASPAQIGGDGGGGALFASGAQMLIINSTFADDIATGGPGGSSSSVKTNGARGGDGTGGAIYSTAILDVWDSTISANTASAGADGAGGLTGVSGSANAGGLDLAGSGLAGNDMLVDSIVSANHAGSEFSDIVTGAQARVSGGYNLIGAGAGNLADSSPNLAGNNSPDLSPLGDYGGPTQTMPPLPGSPAVDQGSGDWLILPDNITTDQRGEPRVVGASVDLGAVEQQVTTISGDVFNDLNGDGIRESGEPGLAGRTVFADIYNDQTPDPRDPQALTDAAGNYVLKNVPEGPETIRVVLKSNERQSNTPFYDDEPITVGTSPVTSVNPAVSTKMYFGGLVTTPAGAGIGGVLVYADLNGDGKFDAGENNKLTNPDGSFAFVSMKPGVYTFVVVTPPGYTGTDSFTGDFTLASGALQQRWYFVLTPKMPALLTGKPIGTVGSFQNQGNTLSNAFDGKLSTYFDAPQPGGDWVGMDLGSAQIVTQVQYAPRSGWASRMLGGEIQASNSANFSTGVVTLLTISSIPAPGVLTTQSLKNTGAYRYYRYLGPAGSYCNIAELEFEG
jgi:hypothetical protein